MDFPLLRSPAFSSSSVFLLFQRSKNVRTPPSCPLSRQFPASPLPEPDLFLRFFLFPFLFWLNSLPEKACAVKGKNSRLNHTEPSKFLLGSLTLFSRKNFLCGGLLLLFFLNPNFLDGSVFFRCSFGVRRKEFFFADLCWVLVGFRFGFGQKPVRTMF